MKSWFKKRLENPDEWDWAFGDQYPILWFLKFLTIAGIEKEFLETRAHAQRTETLRHASHSFRFLGGKVIIDFTFDARNKQSVKDEVGI